MINELTTLLSDRGIKLSKEVRIFCEKAGLRDKATNEKLDENLIQYRTMAEAWVHLVLIGIKHPNRSVKSEPSGKDPIKWRIVPTDWQRILITKAVSHEFKPEIGMEELALRSLSRLESYADIGAEMIKWEES